MVRVSADELPGIEPLKEKVPPKTARIRRRLQQVEGLPPADQRRFSSSSTHLSRVRGRSRKSASG